MKNIEKDVKEIIENWNGEYEIDEIKETLSNIETEINRLKGDDENGYTIKENKKIITALKKYYKI